MRFVETGPSGVNVNQLIEDFAGMLATYKRNGMKIYLLTFMFRQLPGKEATKKKIMEQEVKRVLDILNRNIVRKPESPSWKHLRPVFLGCPDYPVPKAEKKSIRAVSINDGLHFNIIACIPPKRRPGQAELGQRVSRLNVGLIRHFREHAECYNSDRVERIHVERIRETPRKLAGYALKALQRGRVSWDDLLVY